jgi:hypothetical protein
MLLIIVHVQNKCYETITKGSDELEKWSLAQDVMDAISMVCL